MKRYKKQKKNIDVLDKKWYDNHKELRELLFFAFLIKFLTITIQQMAFALLSISV